MLAVDHAENMVNIYLSDETGQYFVNSLERVVHDVEDLGGVFDVDIYIVRFIRVC